MSSSSLGAEVGDGSSIAIHHSRSSAKLGELGAGVVTRDKPGEHLDDLDMVNAIVHGFGHSTSFYRSAQVLDVTSCHALAARGKTLCGKAMSDLEKCLPVSAIKASVRTAFMLT